MRKNDARKLDHKTLEELRMRVVKRCRMVKAQKFWRRLSTGSLTVYGLARYRQAAGMVESQAFGGRPPNSTAKRCSGLRYGDAQEPVAIEIRVRAVDARDGG